MNIIYPALALFALVCFALSPTAQAQLPAPTPDGGYPGDNTAEGENALLSLTTGTANTANGFEALHFNTNGHSNTATGSRALYSNTTGGGNTANGYEALLNNTTGHLNTATGTGALANNTTANNNTADGFQALVHNTTGTMNTAVGQLALFNNNGSSNIALGALAGGNLTIGSNNIDIGSPGVRSESDTIRIGTVHHTRAFITGISRTVVAGAPVVVNAGGQLGVTVSSRRFKDEIKAMDKASEGLLALRPVTFRYNKEIDPEGIPQFGLVAEDVEKVNRDLVIHDKDGTPYSVRYDSVNAMLLNEFLKEHGEVAELKSTVAEQRKGMEAIAAQLKEQAAQIQKVSAQLEASKPAPQVVNNP